LPDGGALGIAELGEIAGEGVWKAFCFIIISFHHFSPNIVKR
jgi:hypothetical protein